MIILRNNPSPDDTEWKFTVDVAALKRRSRRPLGIIVSFHHEAIKLQFSEFPQNRILQNDDLSQFILISISEFRFPDQFPSVVTEYVNRMLKAGLFLNNVQYRFYHHSNSQLRGRSCFMRCASTDEELDARIYALGEFRKIMNIAKRAKRIGLLFSGAEVDYQLNPDFTTDIPDIRVGEEIFSDGCGLVARILLTRLSRKKRIIFRGQGYTPSVIQIRYRGYKGVLMMHPPLDKKKEHLVQFRESMRKFKTTIDTTFSVVDFSMPYKFGRLNNDIVVLLSSLGISNEKLMEKQEQYFKWISDATSDVTSAIEFLSCLDGEQTLVERVLLDGFDSQHIKEKIRALQRTEIANFRKNDKERVRMIIHKSRLLFGVCDPFGVLKEGEVHVRVMVGRQSATTLTQTDVLVVRNPCLHPGDCLKLRAVHHPRLQHLVDCVVFSTKGRRAAPSMSSGGDLDGDKFLICWDPDLVPAKIAESYTYPPNREHIKNDITRADLANHFASYNNAGLAKVSLLHQKWARIYPEGAMCSQCQELNALHSQSVDGARIKIPEKLLTPPEIDNETDTPYIIDVLRKRIVEFETEFAQRALIYRAPGLTVETARSLMIQLLKSEQNALSEYELFNQARALAHAYHLDISRYLPHINVAALSIAEKYELSHTLDFTSQKSQLDIWNSLFRSNIISDNDLQSRDLGGALRFQRLYSSRVHGLAAFFEYLKQAMEEFTRKLILIKIDNRFSVGIFIRGVFPWDEDPIVNEDVIVCPFMTSSDAFHATYRPCTKGYRLHCSDNNFQLFNGQRSDTFIFITRPPAKSGVDIATSIALQKISARVSQQVGRINRTPTASIEIHVLSNRDRVSHQTFDLRFDYVKTEEYLGRFDRKAAPYTLNSISLLSDEDWDPNEPFIREVFKSDSGNVGILIARRSVEELCKIMDFAIVHHVENILFLAFDKLISGTPFNGNILVERIEKSPFLVYALLKAHPPEEDGLPPATSSLTYAIFRNLIRCADTFGIAVLAAIERIGSNIAVLPLNEYIDLLNLASLSVRSRNLHENVWLGQEVMLVMDECRKHIRAQSDVMDYVHKHSLAVLFDQMEESADECPCDEKGKLTRQRNSPTFAKLLPVKDNIFQVIAHVRIDAPNPIRLHSHIRLQAASLPEKGPWIERAIIDGIVTRSYKGELNIDLLHPLPPESFRMDWNIYTAGNVATTKAMLEALLRLGTDGLSCCRFFNVLTAGERHDAGSEAPTEGSSSLITPGTDNDLEDLGTAANSNLNTSQLMAVRLSQSPLTLIWGPPGTGKTTVIVEILRTFVVNRNDQTRILVTASTHNAVDNVLERFIPICRAHGLLQDEEILRVATDFSKVNSNLRSFTIDARVGGDIHQNERLKKKAEERVKRAIIIFTTCTGAGLGTLRSESFDTVLIDEASQVTEPCALIPLVKGCQRAVLVGDHVQLRPTVRPMGKVLQFDVSLLERLYTRKARADDGICRTMLDIQYRFPERLARFPSDEFYEGRLRTGIANGQENLRRLLSTSFAWADSVNGEEIVPTVFIQCSSEEDMGGSSKGNHGQAELVAHIASLLKVPEVEEQLEITVLSPYSKQIRELKNILPAPVTCSTIDSFQGRESDIIIFSTVRCNLSRDIGFLEDERRLNVAWTRAKLALIIVGDRATLSEASPLWERAIGSCREVVIELPNSI